MKTTSIAWRLFLVMSLLTGVVYPLLMTGLAQTLWPQQANGSLIRKNGETVGSELIAQKFVGAKYFWPRPSAVDYNASASSGSNKGPTSADLQKQFAQANKDYGQEMIFSSASGLDPHISPQSAASQINRVAIARGLNETQKATLQQLVNSIIEKRTFGFLGEPRVNVLKLNLEVDARFP